MLSVACGVDTLQFRPYDKRRHGSHVTNTDKFGSD